MEVGRVQVEPDPDEDPRAEPGPVVPTGIGDCLGRDPKRQRLLRQHLLQFLRWDPEPVRPQREVLDRVAEERASALDLAPEPVGLLHSPPVPEHDGRSRHVTAEHPLLERPQSLKRTEVRRHPDDRDRDVFFGSLSFRETVRATLHQTLTPGEREGEGIRSARHPLLDQRMGIDPAEPEPAERRAAGPPLLPRFPGPRLGQHPERTALVVEARRRGGEVGRRRERPVPECQQHLQQGGRARGRQGVADVRLDRADDAPARRPPLRAPEGAQAGELDGIADRRAGRVALDQVDVARVPAREVVRGAHCAELPLRTGREQAALDVVRQPDRRDGRVDPVALPQRVAQPFQDEHPRPLADDQPVALRVERRWPPSGRQRAELREPHLRVERVGSRQPARQHRIGPARQKLVGRKLEGVKRRRTRRVQRKCSTAQPQRLRHETRRQARNARIEWLDEGVRRVGDAQPLGEGSAKGCTRQRRRDLGRQDDVAQHDSDAAAVEPLSHRVPPRVPAGVQRQMEHRVEPRHLLGVEVESLEVEPEVLDESATRRVDSVDRADARIEHLIRIEQPAPRRHRARRIDGSRHVGPEPIQVGRPGEDPPDPDDRHPLAHLHDRVECPLAGSLCLLLSPEGRETYLGFEGEKASPGGSAV